jgi:hypothetical protein
MSPFSCNERSFPEITPAVVSDVTERHKGKPPDSPLLDQEGTSKNTQGTSDRHQFQVRNISGTGFDP